MTCLGLLGPGFTEVKAQEDGETIEVIPEIAFPPEGLEGVRVVPPNPRTSTFERSQSARNRRNRNLEALRSGEMQDSSRELPTGTRPDRPSRLVQSSSSDGTTPASRSPMRRTTSRTTSSSSRARSSIPTTATSTSGSSGIRRAPGVERDPSDPIEYGRLIVITEFDDVTVSVEGQPYPYGSMEGVLLIAGEQYEVVLAPMGQGDPDVTSVGGGGGRSVTVRLQPNETRVLMANLSSTGSSQSTASASTSRRESRARSQESAQESEIGYLGVSSSPRGIAYVDGNNTGQMTPARRIELPPGRHEVQIFYEAENRFSETKNVLIRSGVNTNVFFRDRGPEEETPEGAE